MGRDTIHLQSVRGALLRKRERLRSLLTGPVSAHARYAIGETIAEIKGDPDKYGVGAVALLAASLEEDIPSLYRYATVAECWSRAKFAALLRRTGARGHQLTWSHLVLVAGVTSPVERARWIGRSLDEGLSVRALAALLSARGAVKAGQGGDAVADLERLARASERWVGSLEALVGAALEKLASAADDTGDVHAALERVVSTHERLRAMSDHQLQRLQAELKSRSSRRWPSESDGVGGLTVRRSPLHAYEVDGDGGG